MTAKIGFLHIGKTGGTALKAVIEAQYGTRDSGYVAAFRHNINLRRIIKRDLAERVVFFIRDPFTRFVSGFNSRLRKGAPRHFFEWSPEEEAAFARFKSANALAEALDHPDTDMSASARAAIEAIQHCRLGYEHYLISVDFLEKHRSRIAYIGQQESMAADFEALKPLLHLNEDVNLPTGDVDAHRTPSGFDTALSPRARDNLAAHYIRDFEIYRWCKDERDAINHRAMGVD